MFSIKAVYSPAWNWRTTPRMTLHFFNALEWVAWKSIKCLFKCNFQGKAGQSVWVELKFAFGGRVALFPLLALKESQGDYNTFFTVGLEKTQTQSKLTNHNLFTPNRDFLGDALHADCYYSFGIRVHVTYATSTKALLWQLQVDTYTKKRSNYQFNSWSGFNIM